MGFVPSPYPPSALVVSPSFYCSPRSSLSETALATAICSASSSCSSSSTVGLSNKEREWSASYRGYSPFQGRSRVPFLRPPLLARPVTTITRRSHTGYLVCILLHLVPLRHVSYDGPSLICLHPVFDLALNPDMKDIGLDWTCR